jgi:hypothetical protein
MNEKQIEEFVENFKGILWDDLEDELASMTRVDMANVIRMLKVRFG